MYYNTIFPVEYMIQLLEYAICNIVALYCDASVVLMTP